MKVCVFGLGAIGGLLASRFAKHRRVELSTVARGKQLEAVRERGLTVLHGGEREVVRLRATDRPASLGPQDVVFNCMKAHDAWASAETLASLLGAGTVVVSCQNGLPWWYFDELDGPWRGARLASVDAGDRQRDALGAERMIGCCVYPACEIREPGVVLHHFGDRLEIGEPSGRRSGRIADVSRMLEASGVDAPVTSDIRSAIWTKLWGNISFNPISALTRATLDVILEDPGTRALARQVMVEAQTVGERVGARFRMGVDERMDMLARVGAHRTSMLQDLEAGKRMEIDAVVGVVREIGEIVGIETPRIDSLLALVRQLEETQQATARIPT